MRSALKLICLLLLLSVITMAQAAERPEPAAQAPSLPGFSIDAMDKAVNPCVDFYQYACGNWIKNNPVPPDRARWGRFDALAEYNLTVLRQILEDAAKPDPKRSAVQQKIGDYYASCMDEKTIEAKGIKPIQSHLKRIAAIRNRAGLITEIARLHSEGATALFSFYPGQDFHNSEMMIANVDQGGLGLPDRDYYLKDDVKSLAIRKEYVGHIRKMLELLGEKSATTAAADDKIMALETELAKASMDRTLRRDPRNRDHKMKRQELATLAPAFEFTSYFSTIGAPQIGELNVANPNFSSRQTRNWTASRSRTGRPTYAGAWCATPLLSCRPHLSMKTSASMARCCADRRNWRRAGSAASTPRTSTSAKPWASPMWTSPSASRVSSACSKW